MSGFLDPERSLGQLWHRWVGEKTSALAHPEAAVTLADHSGALAVQFRALGGAAGIRLVEAAPHTRGHRVSWWRQVGGGSRERGVHPACDDEALSLPPVLALFPERAWNAALYDWLVAFFATAPQVVPHPRHNSPADPWQADLLRLHHAAATSAEACRRWPGLRPLYAGLCAAVQRQRPPAACRHPAEVRTEAVVQALLTAGAAGQPLPPVLPACPELPAVATAGCAALAGLRAPTGYRTVAPVPLWGDIISDRNRNGLSPDETRPDNSPGNSPPTADSRRRRAERRPLDQASRDDSLILNRFETLLSLAESLNLNRPVDDDDPEGARQAADETDVLTLSPHRHTPSTRLKTELDLAPADGGTCALTGTFTYPEWDCRQGRYHPDACRVQVTIADEEGDDWEPDAAGLRRIRQVRRQFEALRPRRQTRLAEPDGDDLDLAAVVRARADFCANGTGSERVYARIRPELRDLAVAVLMDVSLSTDSWIGGRRVLDIAREALLALHDGLAACGDPYAIATFTSRGREAVRIGMVKGFDEPPGRRIRRRIQALKPGDYTRMGAAIRHLSALLAARANRHRLLLLLTDGKPNDHDHYEGRYGLEDTRRAVQEARRQGLAVFGMTIDAEARTFFPHLFGRGGYAIFPHAGRLTTALPALYRQVAGSPG